MGTPRMALVAALMAFGGTAAQAAPPLAQRIGHTDPDGMRVANGVHGGAGSMKFGPLLGAAALSTNLIFVHRGTIAPKSGIGQHFKIGRARVGKEWVRTCSSRWSPATSKKKK